MKAIRIAIAALMSVFALNGLAQDKGYFRVEASFLTHKLTNEQGGTSQDWDILPKGGSLGFIYGTALSQGMPLFLETGLRANMAVGSVSVGSTEETDYFMNLSVPVLVGYKFKIVEGISIDPFVGPNLKFNILAGGTVTSSKGDEDVNLFDIDGARRFQVGLNAGVGFNISSFYFGYTFQPDLMPFIKADAQGGEFKTKTKANLITFGVNF